VKAADVMSGVVERLVARIEAGAEDWSMPWRTITAHGWPTNATTGALYRGANAVALWGSADDHRFGSARWATYRQWAGAAMMAASFYEQSGRPQQAEQLYGRLISFLEQEVGADSPALRLPLDKLITMLKSQGRPAEVIRVDISISIARSDMTAVTCWEHARSPARGGRHHPRKRMIQ